jgi:hypothetical protein
MGASVRDAWSSPLGAFALAASDIRSYLVGCDGSASLVRKHLGIHLAGRGTLGAARGIYFRSAELHRRLGERPGVMYWALAPDAAGVIYTTDGGDEWVLNRCYDSNEQANSESAKSIVQCAIGEAIDVEILSDQTSHRGSSLPSAFRQLVSSWLVMHVICSFRRAASA